MNSRTAIYLGASVKIDIAEQEALLEKRRPHTACLRHSYCREAVTAYIPLLVLRPRIVNWSPCNIASIVDGSIS